MTRFLNFLIVALFGTYFYLEYQEPNSAGASQTAASIELAEAEGSDTPAQDEVIATVEAASDATDEPVEKPASVLIISPTKTASKLAPTTQPDETDEVQPTKVAAVQPQKSDGQASPTNTDTDVASAIAAALEEVTQTEELAPEPVAEDEVAVADPTPETLPATLKVYRVNGNVVNARAGPGTNFEVLVRLQRGTELLGTGETEGVWAKAVVTDTGEEVWMHTGFLDEVG
ncbi:MAG: SH3 domain-containing protein [Pseudomonadota bacterium]